MWKIICLIFVFGSENDVQMMRSFLHISTDLVYIILTICQAHCRKQTNNHRFRQIFSAEFDMMTNLKNIPDFWYGKLIFHSCEKFIFMLYFISKSASARALNLSAECIDLWMLYMTIWSSGIGCWTSCRTSLGNLRRSFSMSMWRMITTIPS